MTTAIYRNAEGFPDVQLFVKSTNKNGTVDLVDKDGELKIGQCKIGDKIGDCYLVAVEPEDSKKK